MHPRRHRMMMTRPAARRGRRTKTSTFVDLLASRTKGPTFPMIVPLGIFELASDRREPLDHVECNDRDVRFIAEQWDSVPRAR